MRWAGHAARKGNAYRILEGKLEGKRPLGRPRCRWVDNIIMDLRQIGWCGMDWIDLTEDSDWWIALVNMLMNLQISRKLDILQVFHLNYYEMNI
jgi:hypothetical protein